MSSDSQEDSEGEDLGTIRPSLIRELRNILDLYPDDGQIIKELIQNAEDAGATIVKVLTDKRHFNQNTDARTLKRHPHLKFFKGPALCVYNDAEFSQADWKGIRMLHTSIKEDDPLKVGRFGLGFKSVFHLTDRLVILSGDHIMYMDPFKDEDRYCNWKSVAGRKGKELQSILQSLGGAFGLTEQTYQSGHFAGTLFWFPLRLKESELSKTLYTDHSMEDLLASFKTEAPSLLLFLNRVQRVQILARDDDYDPEERFSVGMAPSCLTTAQRERDRFIQDISKAGASLPQDQTFCITEVVMETSDHDTSQKTSDRWLVANYHCGQKQMSAALSRLLCDHGLCYRPYVGVAVPLSGGEDFQSQLFCFLPLPLDTRSPTGLPIHVHGYFALEQNRRHLKWPTADQLRNSSFPDPAAQWNCLLVAELLPVVYQRALLRLLELCGNDPETFFKAWPDASVVQDRWKPLLQPLYSNLAQQAIFFSRNLGPQWVCLQRSILQRFSGQFTEEVRQSVVKVFTANAQSLVVLPQHVDGTLQQLGFLGGIPDISASRVSQLVPNCLPQLHRRDKLNLLHYLSRHDAHLLLNQPLLPLADGISFGTFRSPGGGQFPTFLCPRQLVELFPCLEAEFSDNNIPVHIREDLQCLAQSGTLSLEELQRSDSRIPCLLEKSLHARFAVGPRVVSAGDTWLKPVWQFLASVPDLSVFSHLTLLPVQTASHQTSLLPLTGRYISSSAHGMSSLSPPLTGALTRLGITVLHDLPDYVMRHNGMLGTFINYPSTQGVLRALQSVSHNHLLEQNAVKTFNTEATGNEKAALVQFLSSVGHSSVSLPSLFFQLNLFRAAFTNQSVSVNQVAQIGPSDLPPVTPPVSLLSCTPSERRAAICLGAREMSLQEIAQTIMEKMCSRTNPYSEHDVIHFMKYFLQTKILVSILPLQHMSRGIPFVQTEGGKLQLPGNVYDPSSTLLQQLFHSQRQSKFPCGEFADPEMLKKLKKLGLKSEHELTPDDLVTAANTISDMWQINDTVSAMNTAEALYRYLKQYSDNMSSDTLSTISNIQCMPCLQDQDKPAHYPTSLPVRSVPGLARPADMYSYSVLALIGSVSPVCRPDMSGTLADHCVLRQEVESTDVLQHLKVVTTQFKQQQVSEYKLILNQIFHHLAQKMYDPLVIKFLKSEKCILRESGESFDRPIDFWIQRQGTDIDLRPYRFPLPVEMQQMRNLMGQCGSSESQTDQMLQTVLEEIQSKHIDHSVSHTDFNMDLQLVKQILEVLKNSQAATDGSTLLPVFHQQTNVLKFSAASECTVMPGMMHANVPPDVGFEIQIVLPEVPSSTALSLGACRMMERALTGVEDLDFGYEQHEDLTTRLHDLLHESYTDGFSVPKELIQNADDACASKVCFLLDERENMHSRTNLIADTMESLQGPAIWAYNDAIFSKSDLENIIRLGAGTKKEDISKVGRFGLGFNAVYNLTDVPCFISGHVLAMFDPQVRYLGKGAGLKLDFTKPINKALLSRMPQQFQPFQDVFGCTLRGPEDVYFKGTLFRFPLRTAEQAVGNKLKSDSYSESKRRDFLKMLLEKAGSLLMFTQNVREVEVFYIPSHCSDPNQKTCLLTVKKTCLETVVSQPQVRMNNKTVLQFMKDHWSKQNSDIKIQQKLEIEMTVCVEASEVCGTQRSDSCTQWQVAWASGTGKSASMAHQKMNEGLVPLAAAAISVSDQGLIPLTDNPSGFYHTGHLFCFLPLPEDLDLSRTVLPVHVNGTFALTSDRRGLIVQTEDDLDSSGSSWNTALYSDAVCRSYLSLLQQVNTEAAVDDDFGRYFDLWPTAGVQCLMNSFYHQLQTDGNKILPVPGQNVWVSFTDAYFLQPDFRDSDCGWIAWNALQRFWKGPGYLVDVPSHICKLMKDKGQPGAFAAKVISEVAFFKDFVFPNLQSEWWKPEEQDRLIHHALMQNKQKINQLVMENSCIPCQGGNLLRKPSELVSPRGLVADLFLTSEQRFPQTVAQDLLQSAGDNCVLNKIDFCSERTLCHLSQLGMITDGLPWEMVLDRARSVGHLREEQCIEESLSRAFSLIKYLSVNIDTNSPFDLRNCPDDIKRSLSQTAFLPILRKPADWPFPWAGDEGPGCSSLAAPVQLSSEAMSNLVACSKQLLDIKALAPKETFVSGKIRKVLKSLGVVVDEDYLNMNFLECVLDQLVMVANEHNRNPSCKELSQSVSSKIYAYLDTCLKRNEESAVRKMTHSQLAERNEKNVAQNILHSKLEGKSIVWTGNMFVHPASVAFTCHFDCTPHLFQLGNTLRMNKHFFQAAGVKETFISSDVLLVLEKLNRENSGVQLCNDTIDLVSRIAQLLANIVRYSQLSEQLDTGRVFLPDNDGFMQQTCRLCVDDCELLNKTEGMKFVSEKIPKETAKLLGVKTKKRQHFSLLTRPIQVKPFGQSEKLTTRIRRLLDGYTFDSSVCKELMQNADDAQATEAKFIMDFRQLPSDKVPLNFESLQGPALCFYNNRSFSAEDMEGIQNLGVGSKGQDDLKIGQFGVGFNAVFHLTDIPSFWTKVDDKEEVICVLDPNCQYIPGAEPSKPGVQFSSIAEVRQEYPDFSSGYLDHVIDTTQPGTLFRFPLRTDKMAEKSEITKKVVTETTITELLETFKDEISTCLLFLNSLQTVGIYSVHEDGTLKQEFEVNKTVDDASAQQFDNFKASLQQASHLMKQNSVGLKNIPILESVVLSKIEDSVGNSVDWLTIHRVGFGAHAGLSANLERQWGEENFRMLPRGGVAVRLRAEGPKCRQRSEDTYQAFCMLPLPVFTGLPVHVNGHFALDHETRRNLWDSGSSKDDVRSEWNNAIALDVVVPAYLTALSLVKSRLFPDNGRGFSQPQMASALKHYHDLFPLSSGDAFWLNIAHQVYKTIAEKELPLFPVVSAERQEVEWVPAVRRNGFPGFFNNLVAMYTEQQSMGHVILTGGVSTSSAHGRGNEPSTKEVAKYMKDLLAELNMKILETPLRIYESFKASGVSGVQQVTASSVLKFLRSSGQGVRGGCNICNLPKPVTDTPLKTASNVQKIIKFVSEASDFLNTLGGLPLCLRQSETLHEFSVSEARPIISSYHYLLPGSAEEFLHHCIIRFFTNLKKTRGVLQTLSVEMFASRLHRTLTDPCFSAGKPCNLELSQLPSLPDGKSWLSGVWKFLEEELKRERPEDTASATYMSELRERAEEMLQCLREWCLIPVQKQEGRQDKQMLYPIKDLHQVVYLSSDWDQTNGSLWEVLKRLPFPFSNTVNHLVRSLVASISHPRALLRALTSCAKKLSASDGDGSIILHYFSQTLDFLTDWCGDARQVMRELRSLPVFPAIGEQLVSLTESDTVLCLNSVPEDGLGQWSCSGPTPLILLRAKYIPKVLSKFLGFRAVSDEDFYSRYLLPTLEFLPQEAILCHMTFLRDKFKWDTLLEDSHIVLQLKTAAFVSVCGTQRKAEEFFSPHEPVFTTMCLPHQFPPEPYNHREWRQFMTIAGMISKVTPALFLQFVEAVGNQGIAEGLTENVATKSQTLVSHLFRRKQLMKRNLLTQVKDVRFILPSNWSSTDEGQQLVKIAQPVGPARLISFSESAFEQHLHLVWSSSWILPQYADPHEYENVRNSSLSDILSWLGLHQNPPKEKVILHLKNISQVLGGEEGDDIFASLQQSEQILVSVMEDIYKYLEGNMDQHDIAALKQVPLVCDIGKRQMLKPANVVVELREKEIIRGHVEKAPLVFGKYFEHFKKLGATQSVTANHYAQFLAWLKTESGDEPLHVEEFKDVKTALDGIFGCLREGSEEQKRITVTALYLPTEEKSLQKSTEIVYKDGRFGSRFQHGRQNVHFFLGFKMLKMNVFTPLEEIKLLPREHQMVLLSHIVKEVIPHTVLEMATEGRESRNLMAILACVEAAIVRLVYYACCESERPFTRESAEGVQNELSNVLVKEVLGLKTQLTLHDEEVPGSELTQVSFVDKQEGPPRHAVVYIDVERERTTSIFHSLAIAVNYVVGMKLNEVHLIEIFQNPSCAMDILDTAGLDECNFVNTTEESVFPAAGKFVPLDQHCYLDNTFYHFRPGEHVGYEVYDPVVENPEEGHSDAVYIYAVVVEEVLTQGRANVPLLARHYRIDLGLHRGEAVVSATRLYKFSRKHTESRPTQGDHGPDRGEAVVSATRLYKFSRKHTESRPTQGACTDVVEHQGPGAASQHDHSSLDMRSVLREIKATLTEAWQQLPEEGDRRRVVKRLVLRWHPDRNHGNEVFFTRVTQKIFHYVDLLNKGRPLPGDAEDEQQGGVSSDRSDSMFNSSFYANMNARARSYRDSEDAGPRFSASSSAHDAGHGRTQRGTNPQPDEARRWFCQAKADAAAALASRGQCDRGHNWICYQCHQAVEKAMKAVIYFRDADIMYMKSHTVPQLASIVGDADIISMGRSLESRVGPHTRMRYPDVQVYPRVPADVYTEEDATWACDIAARVLERVQTLIEHFVDGKPTDENPDPVSADVYKSGKQRKRKLPAERSDPPPPKLSKRAAAATAALLDLQDVHLSGVQADSERANLDWDHAYTLQNDPASDVDKRAAFEHPVTEKSAPNVDNLDHIPTVEVEMHVENEFMDDVQTVPQAFDDSQFDDSQLQVGSTVEVQTVELVDREKPQAQNNDHHVLNWTCQH